MFVGSVHAQVIVSDPLLEGNTTAANTTQNLQWAKQIDQYIQQVQQYTSTLMTLEGLGNSITMTPTQLSKITDANSLIQQNCPGAPGITGIISSITGINLGDKILASQASICANITLVEVDEYNRTVDVVNQMQGYAATAQKLNQLAAAYQEPGNIAAAMEQSTTFNGTILKTMQDWQTSISADEALIKALQQQQQVLAHVALKGSNTILGNLVQAAALKAAFTINN